MNHVIRTDPETAKQLKLLAVQNNLTMGQLLAVLVQQFKEQGTTLDQSIVEKVAGVK